MQQTRPTPSHKTGTTLEGALAALAPFPLATAFAGTIGDPVMWRVYVALGAIACIFICAATVVRRVLIPRIFASLATCLMITSALPALPDNPFLALFLSVVFIFVHVYLFDFSRLKRLDRTLSPVNRSLERLRGSALILPVIAVFRSLFHFSFPGGTPLILGPSILIMSCFLLEYAYQSRSKIFWALGIGGAVFIPLTVVLGWSSNISGCALIFGILVHLLLPLSIEKENIALLDVFFDRPARVLFWSFFLLCLAGAILLMEPSAAGQRIIEPIDAGFNSVPLEQIKDPTLFAMIEQIINRNTKSIDAGQNMFSCLAEPSDDEEARKQRLKSFEDALRSARDNVTEKFEGEAIDEIAQNYAGAITGNQDDLRKTISAITKLNEINREAVQQADRDASRLGIGGSWVVVFMASFVFLAGLMYAKFVTRSLVEPLEELHSVAQTRGSGDPFRRCCGANLPDEITDIYHFVNELLDQRQENPQ